MQELLACVLVNANNAVAAQQALVSAMIAAVHGVWNSLPAEEGGAPPTVAQVLCAWGSARTSAPPSSILNNSTNPLECVYGAARANRLIWHAASATLFGCMLARRQH